MQMTNGRLHEPEVANGGLFASHHPFPWGRIILAVGGTTFTVVSMLIGFLATIGVFNAPVMKPEINAVKVQVEQLQGAVTEIKSSVKDVATSVKEVAGDTATIKGFISGQMVAASAPPATTPLSSSAPVVKKKPTQAAQKKPAWSIFN
jgi:hypothetical protein